MKKQMTFYTNILGDRDDDGNEVRSEIRILSWDRDKYVKAFFTRTGLVMDIKLGYVFAHPHADVRLTERQLASIPLHMYGKRRTNHQIQNELRTIKQKCGVQYMLYTTKKQDGVVQNRSHMYKSLKAAIAASRAAATSGVTYASLQTHIRFKNGFSFSGLCEIDKEKENCVYITECRGHTLPYKIIPKTHHFKDFMIPY